MGCSVFSQGQERAEFDLVSDELFGLGLRRLAHFGVS